MFGFDRLPGLSSIKRNNSVEKFSFGTNLEDPHFKILTEQINFIKEFKDQYNIENEVNAYLFKIFNDISNIEMDEIDILKFANKIDELKIPNLSPNIFMEKISYYTNKRHKSISELKEFFTGKPEDTDSMKSIKNLLNLKDSYTENEIENSLTAIQVKISNYKINLESIIESLREAKNYTLLMFKAKFFNDFGTPKLSSFNRNLFDLYKYLNDHEINYLISLHHSKTREEFMELFGNKLNDLILARKKKSCM